MKVELVRQGRWVCACGWTSRLIVVPADMSELPCPKCGSDISLGKDAA